MKSEETIILWIWNRIKKKRELLNITQDQLAKIAWMPNITLAKIETWKIKNPWILNLIRISKALNWSIDELLEDNI